MPLVFTFLAVGIILYLSYVSTKVIGKKVVKTRTSDYMQVVDTLAVAQDKSIMILKTEGKFYLLSVTATDINLITELKEFDEINSVIAAGGEVVEGIDFKEILSRALHPKKNR